MRQSKKIATVAAALCVLSGGMLAAKSKAPKPPKPPKVKVVKASKTSVTTTSAASLTSLTSLFDLTAYATPAASAVAPVAAAVPAAAPKPTLPGVNLSGGEFGDVPGRIFWQYTYPTTAEIDFFAARGFKLLRIPFRWERLQPTLYGPLVEQDRQAIKTAVDYAVSKGLTVVLDMHDFAGRKAAPEAASSSLIGSAAVGESALADAWARIAGDYRDNPNVWLGLMNEPYQQTPADWWRTAQQLVTDLRAQHFANKVMVPGIAWSGAYNWTTSGNAAQAEQFVDPGNNFAFEVHQYLDADSSGTSAVCVAGAANRMDAVIAWATARKVQLFVGEMGGSGDPSCATEYPAMLRKLNTSGVVIGWTAWGGGTWWNDSYPFKLSPIGSQTTTPHMALLLANMPS